MRQLTIILLLCIGVGCTGTKNTTITSDNLNGTWIPVKQEIRGKELPTAAFEKQKLIMSDNVYTLIAESIDKGEVTYSKGNMDIYGKEGVNAGKHFTAIYKRENDQLTICYNLLGDSYPTGFETKSKPMLFLSVFSKWYLN